MSAETSPPPSVSWAQRSGVVYLTFNVECPKPDIKIENKSVLFKGLCEPDKVNHEVVIPLYGEVVPDQSTQVNKGRYIHLVLAKAKVDEPFWPSLTSDKKKHHWLKIDFNRWQDEDESSDEVDDMNDMFSDKLGGFDADDLDKDDMSSADEDDIPDTITEPYKDKLVVTAE